MKQILVLLVLFAAVSCNLDKPAKIEKPEDTLSFGEFSQDQIYDRLALFPVYTTEAEKDIEPMLTLKEAIEHPRFRIVESQDNMALETYDIQRWRQGNKVVAENKSDQLVYVMAGDVIGGGKQDRVIAEDAVIAAKSLDRLPVYCVEKNRWRYKKGEGDKNLYAFGGYFNVAAPAVRQKVSITRDQSAVWASVGSITKNMNAESSTGTYTAVLNEKESQDKLQAYIDHYKTSLNSEKCIGLVAISGDRIIGADLFGSNNLFKSKLESLLYSYATEAIHSGDTPKLSLEKEQPGKLSQKTLDAYLGSLEYKLENGTSSANSTIFKYKNQVLHLADYLN